MLVRDYWNYDLSTSIQVKENCSKCFESPLYPEHKWSTFEECWGLHLTLRVGAATYFN